MAKQSSSNETEVETRANATVDATRSSVFNDDDLRKVTTWDEAVSLAETAFGDAHDIAAHLGNGFSILDDKNRLIGVPLFIIEMRVNDTGSYGTFASMAVITRANERYIVNDGSTGIGSQVDSLLADGRRGGFIVANGLRVSSYATCGNCDLPRPEVVETCDRCGSTTKERHTGETFYLDTSAAA